MHYMNVPAQLQNLQNGQHVKATGQLVACKDQSRSADKKSKLQLVTLFIQEARVTGDHSYYDKASIKYLSDDTYQKDSNNFEALVMKSIIQMSQHHFSDGLQTATKAQQINPYNAFVYGMLVDGNVESGNYAEAVRTPIRWFLSGRIFDPIHGFPTCGKFMVICLELLML